MLTLLLAFFCGAPFEAQVSASLETVYGDCYATAVTRRDVKIVRLRNGAIVELLRGRVGPIRHGSRAVLMDGGNRIFIEGKGIYFCKLWRAPRQGAKPCRQKVVRAVSPNGDLIFFEDGSAFQSYNGYECRSWLWGSDCVLVGDSLLLNLDSGELVGGLRAGKAVLRNAPYSRRS